MPGLCCLQGAASPFGWAGIQRTPDPGEMALKSSAVQRRTHQGPVLLEADSCSAWDSKDCLGHCLGTVPILPFVKRGRSRAGTGDEHRPALQELQPRRRAQDTAQAEQLPGQDGRNQDTARQGNGRRLCPLLVPTELYPSSPGLCPQPRRSCGCCHHPIPCLGCVCHPQLFPTDHLSFLSIPSPLAASMPSASRTLLLLLSCPLRWFVNFLAPGIPCSRGCRGSTVCWARWAGAIQPLPGTGKKTHKVRKDPTDHLSQQCTPVFVH